MSNKMLVEEFNQKYAEQGGMNMLTEMRAHCFRTVYIANHFGVSADTVRVWMNEYFGSAKDPREGRREEIVKAMVEFARVNIKEEFDFAYRGTSYYQEALLKAKEQGMYDSK